jgi:hypothetical protein
LFTRPFTLEPARDLDRAKITVTTGEREPGALGDKIERVLFLPFLVTENLVEAFDADDDLANKLV